MALVSAQKFNFRLVLHKGIYILAIFFLIFLFGIVSVRLVTKNNREAECECTSPTYRG